MGDEPHPTSRNRAKTGGATPAPAAVQTGGPESTSDGGAGPPQVAEPTAGEESGLTQPVDVNMLRRSWPTLVEKLRGARKAILSSLLASATPVSFDGSTLEIAFPPDRQYGVAKVEEREADLRDALHELFGISPRIACVVRAPVAGGTSIDLEEEPPIPEADALARIQSELDARIAPQPEG